MINSTEQKILDNLQMGINKLYVTDFKKVIGCSHALMYRYLKRLESKGFISRYTENIIGGKRGDRHIITVIEKIKA